MKPQTQISAPIWRFRRLPLLTNLHPSLENSSTLDNASLTSSICKRTPHIGWLFWILPTENSRRWLVDLASDYKHTTVHRTIFWMRKKSFPNLQIPCTSQKFKDRILTPNKKIKGKYRFKQSQLFRRPVVCQNWKTHHSDKSKEQNSWLNSNREERTFLKAKWACPT